MNEERQRSQGVAERTASAERALLVFTKPAVAGRVKTRLIGALSPEQAAELHQALLLDLLARLAGGAFEVALAWALAAGEEPPAWSPPWVRQAGDDLGARLHRALAAAALEHAAVAAVGSDHPGLTGGDVESAFARLEAGADVVLGPATDGGYYLIALRAGAVHPELFQGIPWSTDAVLERTLERCAERDLAVELLPTASDVDTPQDLDRLAAELTTAGDRGCPRTRALLAAWGRLPALEPEEKR
jgi:hypothetical protein